MNFSTNITPPLVAINPLCCRIYTFNILSQRGRFVLAMQDNMEVCQLKDDMKVICVRAKSFPDDIKQSFSQLIELLPTIQGRTFFGVSYQAKSRDMVYHAAVLEEFEGEAEEYGCDSFVIEKGKYLAETLKDWKKDERSIGLTFKKMAETRMDTEFPCIEWYQGDDVVCMVKIVNSGD